MDKSFLALIFGLNSLGGLLACPIFPGYFAYIPIPIGTGLVALSLLKFKKSKYIFAALAATSFLVGCALRFMPRANSGGVGDAGIALLLIVWIPCMRVLHKIWTTEAQAERAPEGNI